MPSRELPRYDGDRWSLVTHLIGPAASVLDVGCRDRALAAKLPPDVDYVGVDLGPPADVIANAEEPLPFESRSFEVVVLADVLEHLDDPHAALDECMRIARRGVVVLLPNVFCLPHRIAFARGRMLSGKYRFGSEPVRDRHRWILDVTQAREFAQGRAAGAGWHVGSEYAYGGGFRRRSVRTVLAAARLAGGPDLWAWEYGARLEPLH